MVLFLDVKIQVPRWSGLSSGAHLDKIFGRWRPMGVMLIKKFLNDQISVRKPVVPTAKCKSHAAFFILGWCRWKFSEVFGQKTHKLKIIFLF